MPGTVPGARNGEPTRKCLFPEELLHPGGTRAVTGKVVSASVGSSKSASSRQRGQERIPGTSTPLVSLKHEQEMAR